MIDLQSRQDLLHNHSARRDFSAASATNFPTSVRNEPRTGMPWLVKFLVGLQDFVHFSFFEQTSWTQI